MRRTPERINSSTSNNHAKPPLGNQTERRKRLAGSEEAPDKAELKGAPMSDKAKIASHMFGERQPLELSVLHFDSQSVDQIKDADPHSLATVSAADASTFSELARRGFHLMDMRGETWMMHRV
jgi:hypothetical protein